MSTSPATSAAVALPDGCIDYTVAIHALPEIPYGDLIDVLQELRRVLKPGGALRLALPDIDSGLYPTGEGLLLFSTLEEAVGGVEEISRDYARHARAARALAEERFDSDQVLGRLHEQLGGGAAESAPQGLA